MNAFILKLSFVFQIDGHGEDVNTVAFADSTSQILYSGGDDGLCKVLVRLYSRNIFKSALTE